MLTARSIHVCLNTALAELHQHNTEEMLTAPVVVLGCREFLAEVLARVSAAYHTPAQAEEAFTGLVEALHRSVQRNIRLLQAGKDGADLSWLPGA